MSAGLEENPNTSDRSKRIIRRAFSHENSILGLALAILIIAMSVATKGLTTRLVNVNNILAISSIRGVAAVGEAFVILTAGIDLSVGGIGLFAGIFGAALITQGDMCLTTNPTPLGAAILLILLMGAGWGAMNGSAVSRLGMPPLIVTLAIWQISDGAAFQMCGGRSITNFPEGMAVFGLGGGAGGVAVPAVIWIVVSVVAYLVLQYTTFGRQIYAVGGNPVSSWLAGVDVRNVQLLVYVISGALAGLAAILSLGRVMTASMNSLAGLELDAIAAVCIGGVSLSGGRGNMIGVVLGVLIIGVINNGMSVLMAGPAMQAIVKGLIIFGAVAADYIRHRS
jgi:ribose/xylose/arabinose/galactoside ABC-type transport system permease subunit